MQTRQLGLDCWRHWMFRLLPCVYQEMLHFLKGVQKVKAFHPSTVYLCLAYLQPLVNDLAA